MMIMIMLMVTMSCKYVAAASPCPVCAMEAGICEDPHVVGFDGKVFDIWNAGDYLVLRESDGSEVWLSISYRPAREPR